MPRMQDGFSENECMAARYLWAAGWTFKEIALVFETQDSTLGKHINATCSHPTLDEPKRIGTIPPEVIARARWHKRLTQRELGEIIGVSHTTVSSWERGLKEPRPSTTKKLRDVLDIGDDNTIDVESP